MRFITDFELNEYTNDAGYLANKKYEREMNLGKLIADTFGWQNPVNNNKLHHRLEIEAFPMGKWVEFKQKLIENFADDISARSILSILIEQLESLGKPSGDAKRSSIL